MKKFLILMLVLGLAGAAQAALTLTLTYDDGSAYGGEDVAIGETMKVTAVQDAELAYNSGGVGGEMFIDYLGENGAYIEKTPKFDGMTYSGWEWAGTPAPPYGTIVDGTGGKQTVWHARTAQIGNYTDGTPGTGSWVGLGLYGSTWYGFAYESTFEFTFDATVTTDIEFVGASTWDADDDLTGDVGVITTLNVVPEPITIALLGLGGLFLRRRK